MRVSLIAALDRNHAIGRDNDLPWRLPNDLKRFKALTLGKPLLMGRKTAESLGRALPGRLNMVLTRRDTVPFEGMRAVSSVDEAFRIAAQDGGDTLCVIGGAEIYALMLARADVLHLTWVDTVVEEADVFFPPFDTTHWRELAREWHPADDRHDAGYTFVDYVRVD